MPFGYPPLSAARLKAIDAESPEARVQLIVTELCSVVVDAMVGSYAVRTPLELMLQLYAACDDAGSSSSHAVTSARRSLIVELLGRPPGRCAGCHWDPARAG